ncbi:MAG: hypothetical protein PX635_00820 [Nostocales cyanobacterium LE14-WE12]|nr:hypothetical protein [Nostocales cyanobacterium LE14-WE12]
MNSMEYKGLIEKMIVVKLTTRNRPSQALEALRKAKDLANNPSRIKWLISLDTDDELCGHEFTLKLRELLKEPHIYYGASKSKIHAINRDLLIFSQMEYWDIVVSLSDDQTCVKQGWDSIIREAMPNSLDASLWYYDSSQPRINTMEILGINYWDRTQTIYHPEYKSFYCDNEATEVAKMLGKLIKSPDVLFRHDHPACQHPTSLRDDGLYQKNQLAWDYDKELFNKRRAINFGL